MDTRVAGAADAPEGVARVTYEPMRSLAVLLLRNLGLTIVTLGIYRFWAKTALRQFF
jgi:hypothetical protein